jgi:thioredoxin reductase (NADPH)
MIETDAVIVGAGPVGLFQAFQLGLQDIRCHLIDALPHVGGQCAELYADKPIYDIPGLPFCTGRELVERLQQQIRPFAPTFHLHQEVSQVTPRPDGRIEVHTSTQQHFVCKTLFIAAGVGAFQPRKLNLDGAPALEGHHIHYHLSETTPLTDQHVWVLGGEAQAVEVAVQLSHMREQASHSVTLIHRRDVFQAEPQALSAMRDAVAAGRLQLQIGQITALQSADQRLQAVQVATPEGETIERTAQQLLVCWGLSPKLGPVAHWGLEMARKQLVVNTENFATSVPGIFAVGDINTYPGKKKLILCGFHEATLAAFGAADIVHPNRKTLLQYTTTSSELHRLLGVN